MAINKLLIYRSLIKIRVRNIKDYIHETQMGLTDRQKQIDKQVKEALAQVTDEEEEQWILDMYSEDAIKYKNIFPLYFNESALYIAYSFLEATLKDICKYTQTGIKLKNKQTIMTIEAFFSNKANKGSYIKKCKDYLEKECNVKLLEEDTRWTRIDNVRELRNLITHSNSDLSKLPASEVKKYKKSIAYLNRSFGKSIQITENQKCEIVNNAFVSSFLTTCEEYLFYIIDKAKIKC